jgi:putative transposase
MSFWRTYYHLVWATDNRTALITPSIEERLFPYLIAKAADLGVYVYAIGGWTDHIHLIVAIPPALAVADAVQRLKGSSSHYLNHEVGFDSSFAWQTGYGVLTLGERQRGDAEAYVRNQKQHHQDSKLNSWLEYYSQLDEAPINKGLLPGRKSSGIREEGELYQSFGEPLF